MKPTTPSTENARELRDLYEEHVYKMLHILHTRSRYGDINCYEGIGCDSRISMFSTFLMDHGKCPFRFFSQYITKSHIQVPFSFYVIIH